MSLRRFRLGRESTAQAPPAAAGQARGALVGEGGAAEDSDMPHKEPERWESLRWEDTEGRDSPAEVLPLRLYVDDDGALTLIGRDTTLYGRQRFFIVRSTADGWEPCRRIR